MHIVTVGLAGALLGLLAATIAPAQAQQPWLPFRPSSSHQLREAATPGDTAHVLRLGAGAPVPGTAADSLFRFSGRVGRGVASQSCGSVRVLPDNLFGATLRSQPKSVFVLAAANGRSLVLRPRAALGVAWATGVAGLSASVTARGVAPVLGSAPDSVVTITFSDGQVLRLSRRYGLLDGPSLDSYLNGRNRRRQLVLSALPERRLGVPVTGVLAVYDYQPGDVFQRIRTISSNNLSSVCQQFWTQDSILTRATSRTGDTVIYTLQRRQKSQGFGNSNAPVGFCQTPSTVASSLNTITQVVIGSKPDFWGPQVLTNYFDQSSTTVLKPWSSSASRNPVRWAGRFEYNQLYQINCISASPDSVVLTNLIDNGRRVRLVAGLGEAYDESQGIYYTDITQLTAFRKGSQSWGVFFRKGQLLAARAAPAAAATAAFPNPFGTSLTAAFTLTTAQTLGVTLCDALGRTVLAVAPARLPAGAQQLAVPTAGLPAGVYSLHLRFGADGRTEVLRVVKAE